MDTTIVTGQYVRISQTPASVGERLLARVVDGIIIVIYCFAFGYVLVESGLSDWNESTFLVAFVLLFLPVWLYSFLFEMFNEGQTPGKRLMNIKVVMVDGTTPTMGAYLLRWLLYTVDVAFTGGLGVVFVLLTRNNQRIGDLAAGTMVVRVNPYRKVRVSLDEYKHLSEDYIPVYAQVADLSFEQFSLVEKVLQMEDSKQEAYVSRLSNKLKSLLKVDVTIDDRSFLETVKRDYEYYAFVEI